MGRTIALAKVLGALALAGGGATILAYCTLYGPDLVPEIEAGSGIGFWSGAYDAGGQTCFSAGEPTPAERPAAGDTSEVSPIYLAVGTMRIGSQDANFQPDAGAWEDLGFDLDGVCTNSPTCTQDDPTVSCKPTVAAIPYDGNYCRDNTFGKLEVQAASIPEVGGKYGLNDDAFNCALCTGAYNFVMKLSHYNGGANDDSVRVDLYPSPGLVSVLPWSCTDPSWRVHPCFTADMPWYIRDTAVTQDAGGPNLPDAVLSDPNAYVKDGYVVAQLPTDTLFWFPTIAGRKSDVATAFPLKFTQAVVAGHVTKAEDGTWSIVDGTIAGRSRESDIIEGFRLIGFCDSDPNYTLMQGFLHGSLDILASGQNDPNATCDSVSVGIAFTARQATPGPLIHVDDLVECALGDGGADAGADGSTDAGADATNDATGD
ncbi:MAG TPA: hypothetical protein VGH28_30300 [Polyangiaceae bacterium]